MANKNENFTSHVEKERKEKEEKERKERIKKIGKVTSTEKGCHFLES